MRLELIKADVKKKGDSSGRFHAHSTGLGRKWGLIDPQVEELLGCGFEDSGWVGISQDTKNGDVGHKGTKHYDSFFEAGKGIALEE
jgi:hypothetical protein